jgi:hypothetical protein
MLMICAESSAEAEGDSALRKNRAQRSIAVCSR